MISGLWVVVKKKHNSRYVFQAEATRCGVGGFVRFVEFVEFIGFVEAVA
jgi:hypothetical protein